MGTVPCGFPEVAGILFARSEGSTQTAGGFWPNRRGIHAFPPLSGVDKFQRGTMMKKKIDIAAIPELNTSVGMHGSVKQKEVGGPLCLGVVIAIIIGI
jgi:hypothetical protein